MGEIDIFSKMSAIDSTTKATLVYGEDSEQARRIAEHRAWLQNIRHERPKTSVHHKVGVPRLLSATPSITFSAGQRTANTA